ncbi:MAG: NAD(P)/FAD-dependent oxidoreductase [Acidimicrobiia bacterium]|nr:NAD(P)/FAD-dependent oxidoreductase [Acidimicrobiia bacterium]MDH5289893.1 NAD(P)/FAD-dependent oxidoreductase [Acidimicrobiia bacterium]
MSDPTSTPHAADATAAAPSAGPAVVDAVVVGAGFAGLYMLYRLRERGLSAMVFEAGTDVGGTWYWNRYPGARCDVPSMEYSYSFDPDLEQDWEWTELMAAQPEILAYARHVADRFDLRRDITFETRVTAAHWSDDRQRWRVRTDRSHDVEARWCIMATGCLSVPNTPDLPGLGSFAGTLLHTGRWPKEEPDLSGLRVGVIGTGSSGVQAIPVLAERAGHLTVFQRSPVYTVPAGNKPLRPETATEFKARYAEIRERQRNSATGFLGPLALKEPRPPRTGGDGGSRGSSGSGEGSGGGRKGLLDLAPEEREAAFDRFGPGAYQRFRDVYTDPEANEVACELFRREIRKIVQDPDTAAGLEPREYPLACKRPVIDTHYYETFNRPDVTLVDLRRSPLVEVTPAGIRTTEAEVELDVLVLATGFDAMTGALSRIDLAGRAGRPLADVWADGPRTYLGLQMEDFPNLFMVNGPGSPSVLSNMIVSIEHHVEWIAAALDHLAHAGRTTIEPAPEAVEAWVALVNELAEGTMYTAPSCNSWYLGSNIEGKPRVFMPYVGGFGRYRQRCTEIADAGYEGFVLA